MVYGIGLHRSNLDSQNFGHITNIKFIGGSKGVVTEMCAHLLGPIFFIFMEFILDKLAEIIARTPIFRIGTPSSENLKSSVFESNFQDCIPPVCQVTLRLI